MTLVESWFVSAIGGAFSVLTVFYVIGLAVGIGRFFWSFGSLSKGNAHPD